MNNLHFMGILLILIFIIPFCSSICEKEQIDINSASIEALDELYGIGPVKAQAIIDYRESKKFESVGELVNVYGIGEITLEKIKEQKLACVEEGNFTEEVNLEEQEKNESEEGQREEEESEKEEELDEEKENTKLLEYKINLENNKKINLENNKNITLYPINLNIENLKNNNKKNPDLSLYGLFIFCLLLGFLFIKRKIKSNKNEFE